MSFQVRRNTHQFEIVLSGECPSAKPLQMTPKCIEPMLTKGKWLVLAFAVWSAPDRQAIAIALSLAQRLAKRVQVGIRPFDEFKEIQPWCPDMRSTTHSPIWFLLDDGRPVAQREGMLSEAEAERWVRDLLFA